MTAPKAVTKTPTESAPAHKPEPQKPTIVASTETPALEYRELWTGLVCFEPTTEGTLVVGGGDPYVDYELCSDGDASKGVKMRIYGDERILKRLVRGSFMVAGLARFLVFSDDHDSFTYVKLTIGVCAPSRELGWHPDLVSAQLEPNLDWLKTVPGGGALTLSHVQVDAVAEKRAA